MIWYHNANFPLEALGLIPEFISEHDPRPAREQFHTAYSHGGGWHSFEGFELIREGASPLDWKIVYPGDPPLRAGAFTSLREEFIIVFPYAWVMIWNGSGAWEIARID